MLKAEIGLMLFLAASAGASAQEVVPVHEEPRHHLVLEQSSFQILDIRFLPGDTTLFHTHDAPIHYVVISASSINTQVLGETWSTVGTDSSALPVGSGSSNVEYARQPVTHRVANTGSNLFRLIAVVNRGRGRLSPPENAGVINPMPGSIEAESEWFGRARLSLQAGEEIEAANLADPVVAIQVSTGKSELHDDGRVGAGTNAPGDWFVLDPATPQTLRNPGPGAITLVLVEVRQ
jgi:quercetin dioxygenase-like cupin family protein